MEKICLQSSYSGDYLRTPAGEFRHTNGHWWIDTNNNGRKKGDLKDLPSGIVLSQKAGNPHVCSEITVNVEALRIWASTSI